MQVFDSIRHTMLVRRVAALCVVFALVALSCRPFLAQAQAGATRGDRSGEFGTSVTVGRSGLIGLFPQVRSSFRAIMSRLAFLTGWSLSAWCSKISRMCGVYQRKHLQL